MPAFSKVFSRIECGPLFLLALYEIHVQCHGALRNQFKAIHYSKAQVNVSTATESGIRARGWGRPH